MERLSTYSNKAMNLMIKALKFLYTVFLTRDDITKPSSKKIIAFILVTLAIMSKVELYFFPSLHWSVVLFKKGMPESVIIALIASLDALAMWAFGVYGWAKSKGV